MHVETYDIGNTVVCDICNEDFTNSEAKGGYLFGSKGVCPNCATGKWHQGVLKYQEQHFIRERARTGESFRDFVLRLRGGNNTITIRSF